MNNALIRKISIALSVICSMIILCTAGIAEAATTMTISPTTANIMVGSTTQISVKVNKKAVATSKCIFTTSSKSIATVSAKGVVTAKKVGTATITVKLRSNSKIVKKCTVKVKPKMTLSEGTSANIQKGYVRQITVKLGGKAYANNNFTFTTSNKNVLTVTAGGYIKGIKAGKATITVRKKSDKYIYATCTVTVKNNVVKTDASALNFSVGGTRTMKVTLNGANAGGGSLNFSSSNTSVATVSANGLITGKKAGTAVITAKCKNDATAKATCTVKVVGGNSFTITPSDLPINGYGMNFSTYTSSSRVYYMLSSYMRTLESLGGGTLTLTKGTYPVCNILYVPSNVNIVLKDGVVLEKSATTGSSSMNASGSLLCLCAPSIVDNGKKYSKYNGVHDVSITGEGNAIIKMDKAPSNVIERCSMVTCHNKNISIKNLTFSGNFGNSHYIEIDASYNVTVQDCTFLDAQMDVKIAENECINIDINDANTTGFFQKWSSLDCTPNQKITIKDCIFRNVQSGVGTHSYTPDIYHTEITVDSCVFENCVKYGINTTNWRNSTITNNTFDCIGRDDKGNVYSDDTSSQYITKGIYLVGSKNIVIENNTFRYVNFGIYCNGRYKASYTDKYTFNDITDEEFAQYGEANYMYKDTCTSDLVRIVWYGKNESNNDDSIISPPRYYFKDISEMP